MESDFTRSDVVCLVIGFRRGGIDWLASDDNILLSTDRNSLLLDQYGLSHRLRLLGVVHLLTRLHGHLRFLRLGSFLCLLFVVLNLLSLAVDDNLSDHDIEDHSNSGIDTEKDVEVGLDVITVITKGAIVAAVIDSIDIKDGDDHPNDSDDQYDDFNPEQDDEELAEADGVGFSDNKATEDAEDEGVNVGIPSKNEA